MDHEWNKSQLHRLKRIEGQIRGIQKMIEEDRYCIDVLTQLKAIKSAVIKVEESIIENHLDHCVKKAVSKKTLSAKEQKELILEMKELIKKR